MVFSRRRGKAEVDRLRIVATNGANRTDYEGIVIEHFPAEVYRAAATRAHRLHEARILAGHEDEQSAEAEAGALLEAETANEIHEICEIAKAWREANRG